MHHYVCLTIAHAEQDNMYNVKVQFDFLIIMTGISAGVKCHGK